MKNTKINISLLVEGEKFLKILDKYDSEAVNAVSNTEQELLQKYNNFTNDILIYAKRIADDHIFFLNNEIRAMFGHLADYRANNDNDSKANLHDAYTHFRRLNIDIFKVLCDEFDKFCLMVLERYYHYDFRNLRQDFLEDYAVKYFSAKQKYEDAKHEENVGSNRKNNLVSFYYKAVYSYVEAFKFYQEHEKKIKNTKKKQKRKYIFDASIAFIGLVLSVVEAIFGV